MREMWDAAQAGKLGRAAEIDAELRPVYAALAVTTNPMPLKAALEIAGLIPSGALRLPLVPVDAEQRATIRAALETAGIAVAA
jgi:4-hydroxy-tetrahydrodipicolinate synthase